MKNLFLENKFEMRDIQNVLDADNPFMSNYVKPKSKEAGWAETIGKNLATGTVKMGKALAEAVGSHGMDLYNFAKESYVDLTASGILGEGGYSPELYEQTKKQAAKEFDNNIFAVAYKWEAEGLKESSKAWQGILDRHPEWQTEPPSSFVDMVANPKKAAGVIAQSIPLLVSSGIAMVGGAAPLAVGIMYAVEGQEAAEQIKNEGGSYEQQQEGRFLYGSVAATIEMMQLDGLLKIGKGVYNHLLNKTAKKAVETGSGLGVEILKTMVSEAAEEMAQGTWQEITLAHVAGIGQEGGLLGFIDRRLQEAYVAMAMSGMSVGVGVTTAAAKQEFGTTENPNFRQEADLLYEITAALEVQGFDAKMEPVTELNAMQKDIQRIARNAGTNIVFFDAEGNAAAEYDGMHFKEQNITLINKNNKDALTAIFGHEYVHRLAKASPERFNQLREAIQQAAEGLPKFKRFLDRKGVPGRQIDEEAIAYVIGEFADNRKFLYKLVGQNPNIARRLLDGIKDFAFGIKSMGEPVGDYITNLESVQKNLEAAFSKPVESMGEAPVGETVMAKKWFPKPKKIKEVFEGYGTATMEKVRAQKAWVDPEGRAIVFNDPVSHEQVAADLGSGYGFMLEQGAMRSGRYGSTLGVQTGAKKLTDRQLNFIGMTLISDPKLSWLIVDGDGFKFSERFDRGDIDNVIKNLKATFAKEMYGKRKLTVSSVESLKQKIINTHGKDSEPAKMVDVLDKYMQKPVSEMLGYLAAVNTMKEVSRFGRGTSIDLVEELANELYIKGLEQLAMPNGKQRVKKAKQMAKKSRMPVEWFFMPLGKNTAINYGKKYKKKGVPIIDEGRAEAGEKGINESQIVRTLNISDVKFRYTISEAFERSKQLFQMGSDEKVGGYAGILRMEGNIQYEILAEVADKIMADPEMSPLKGKAFNDYLEFRKVAIEKRVRPFIAYWKAQINPEAAKQIWEKAREAMQEEAELRHGRRIKRGEVEFIEREGNLKKYGLPGTLEIQRGKYHWSLYENRKGKKYSRRLLVYDVDQKPEVPGSVLFSKDHDAWRFVTTAKNKQRYFRLSERGEKITKATAMKRAAAKFAEIQKTEPAFAQEIIENANWKTGTTNKKTAIEWIKKMMEELKTTDPSLYEYYIELTKPYIHKYPSLDVWPQWSEATKWMNKYDVAKQEAAAPIIGLEIIEEKMKLNEPYKTLIESIANIPWFREVADIELSLQDPIASEQAAIEDQGENYAEQAKRAGKTFRVAAGTSYDRPTGRVRITVYRSGLNNRWVIAREFSRTALELIKRRMPDTHKKITDWAKDRQKSTNADKTQSVEALFMNHFAHLLLKKYDPFRPKFTEAEQIESDYGAMPVRIAEAALSILNLRLEDTPTKRTISRRVVRAFAKNAEKESFDQPFYKKKFDEEQGPDEFNEPDENKDFNKFYEEINEIRGFLPPLEIPDNIRQWMEESGMTPEGYEDIIYREPTEEDLKGEDEWGLFAKKKLTPKQQIHISTGFKKTYNEYTESEKKLLKQRLQALSVGAKSGYNSAMNKARKIVDAMMAREQLDEELRVLAGEMVRKWLPRDEHGKWLNRVARLKSMKQMMVVAKKIKEAIDKAEHKAAVSALKATIKDMKSRWSTRGDIVGLMPPEQADIARVLLESFELAGRKPNTVIKINDIIDFANQVISTSNSQVATTQAQAILDDFRGQKGKTTSLVLLDTQSIEAIMDELIGLDWEARWGQQTIAGEKSEKFEAIVDRVVKEIAPRKLIKQPSALQKFEEGAKRYLIIGHSNLEHTLDYICGGLDGDYKSWDNGRYEMTRQIYDVIDAGVSRQYRMLVSIRGQVRAALKAHDITMEEAQRLVDTKINVKLGGENFELNLDTMMAIYMDSKNPHNLKVALQNGYEDRDTKIGKITQEEIDELVNLIPQKVKDFCDDIGENVLDGECKDAINSTSIMIEGYPLAKVDNYWSAKRFKQSKVPGKKPKQIQSTIEGLGLLKERVGTGNPLLLKSFFMTVLETSKNAAAYHGLAPALRDAKAILNNDKFIDALKANGYKGYIKHLHEMIKRVEDNSAEFDVAEKALSKMTGKFAKSVFSLNPKLWVRQYVSIALLSGYIDPKYFAEIRFAANKEVLSEAMRWSPQIKNRIEGHRYERDIGSAVMGHKSLPFYFDTMPFTDQMLFGMSYFDTRAILDCWRVAKAEVKDNNPGLTGAEYYSAVADRAEFLIRKTQPTWHVKDRSVIGSTTSPFTRAMTMFSSQREKIVMMGVSAARVYQKTGNTAQFARKLGNIAMNAVLIGLFNAGFGFIVYRKRKTIKEIMFDFLGDIVGLFYGGKYVWDAVKRATLRYQKKPVYGETIELPPLRLIETLFSGIGDFSAGARKFADNDPAWKKDMFKAADNAAEAVALFHGLPYIGPKEIYKGLTRWGIAPEIWPVKLDNESKKLRRRTRPNRSRRTR